MTLEAILEKMQNNEFDAPKCHSYLLKIEQKIQADMDSLFEGLGGGQIHEILSKIGYAKNYMNLVIETKGAMDFNNALKSIITQLSDILGLYRKSGVSTQLIKE
ncbi:MAG TPA: hypothetical protein VMV49_14515 [Candidatus Deferrimicrobium sp.]|nr:hypothetical protein [Candidatus Deferrimicrobium sp.]